jgi:predicted transcriptional regulator
MAKDPKSASSSGGGAADSAESDASSFRVVLVRGETVPRVFVHLAGNYLLRTDRERRELYFGDLELASIAATVGIGSLEADFRDPDFREQFNDYMRIIGTDRQRPMNTQSVTDATGLPRETVRRKLRGLVQKGVLIEKDGGFIYRPGYAQQPRQQAAFERGIRDTLMFVNLCLTRGILRIRHKPGALAKPRPARLSGAAKSPTSEIDTSNLRVVLVRGATVPRGFVHLGGNYLLRADRERRNLYFGDLDLASIAATIGVGSLEADFRDPSFRERFNDYRHIIETARQRPLNAHSIAEATGLPRETVRRKLKFLVQKGVLIERDGGYIYKPGYAYQPQRHEAFERAIRDTQQFINRCLNTGILRLTSNPGSEASTSRKAAQPAKLRQ